MFPDIQQSPSWALTITFCEEAMVSMTASITTPVLNILPEFQPPHAHILKKNTTNKEEAKKWYVSVR